MDQQTQHPPMSGDDALAKSLQFEETPVEGGSNTPAPMTDDTQDAALAAIGADQTSGAGPIDDPLLDEPIPPTMSDQNAPKTDDDGAVGTGDMYTPPSEPSDDTAEAAAPVADDDLHKLKTSALDELRPLVSHLDLQPEEKFDTLLLIIRSTDDQSLLEEAHEAAKNIPNDARRAQALLDIIKEIDYFASKK